MHQSGVIKRALEALRGAYVSLCVCVGGEAAGASLKVQNQTVKWIEQPRR